MTVFIISDERLTKDTSVRKDPKYGADRYLTIKCKSWGERTWKSKNRITAEIKNINLYEKTCHLTTEWIESGHKKADMEPSWIRVTTIIFQYVK